MATVEAEFGAPGAWVAKPMVFAGVSAKKDEFLTQARPARIVVEVVSVDGDASTRRFTLKDRPGQQTFDLRGFGVTRIRVTAETAYGAGRGRRPAVAAIEFSGRRRRRAPAGGRRLSPPT